MENVTYLKVDLYWGDEYIFNALASNKFLQNLQHLQLFHFKKHLSHDFPTVMIISGRRHFRSVKVFCSDPADVESVNQ